VELLQSANVALRFVLELCALAAFGYWGFHAPASRGVRIALAIAAPLLAALVWILLGAPGAEFELRDPLHFVLEVLFFGGAAVALAAASRRNYALALGGLAVINRALMYVWGQ
jgi:Protein of unknown function (DUF2568)